MSKIVIYGLVCPVENKVMYVGKSKDASIRLKQHLDSAYRGDKTIKSEWLRSLKRLNLSPSIEIIDSCSIDDWKECESRWIEHYKSINPNLKNSRPGGGGHAGIFSSADYIVYQKKERDHHCGTKISYNLFALKRKLELQTGKAYTWRKIGKETGVHYNTLNNLANNKTSRIDVDILRRILEFFQSQGMNIVFSELFVIDVSDTITAGEQVKVEVQPQDKQ